MPYGITECYLTPNTNEWQPTLGPKNFLLFPETRPTLVFTLDPKNFMDFTLGPKFFGFNFQAGLAASSSCIMSGSSFHWNNKICQSKM